MAILDIPPIASMVHKMHADVNFAYSTCSYPYSMPQAYRSIESNHKLLPAAAVVPVWVGCGVSAEWPHQQCTQRRLDGAPSQSIYGVGNEKCISIMIL